VSVVFAIVSLVWTLVIFEPADPSRVYFGTDTRIASILVGAALAAWLAGRGHVRARSGRVALESVALAAVVVLALAFTRLSGSSDGLYRGGLFACACAVAVVIAAAVHPSRGPVGRILSFRPFCALGLVSYGVYLWHWPIYVVINPARAHLTGWPLLAVQVGVTLVIAVISYRHVEQPIRRAAFSIRRARSFSFVVATGAALVVAITVTTASAPTPPAFRADRIRQPITVRLSRTAGVERVRRVQRVLVVGNSVALYTGDEGFKRLHTTPRLDVLNLGSFGCRLLPEETRARDPAGDVAEGPGDVCRDKWALAVSVFRPDVVVMLVSDPTDTDREIEGHWTAPCERAYDNVFQAELHLQIRLLASKGAHVIVATAAYSGLPYKTSSWYRHADCQNVMLRRVVASEPRAVLADVFRWMCPRLDRNCDGHLLGMELRPDGVHFRDASARALAAWLIAQGQRHGVFSDLRVDGPEAREVAFQPSP
jgi:hypothetical protein